MIRIYGHSDDVVVIDGDIINETSPNKSILIGTKDSGLTVKMNYGIKNGNLPVWRTSINQLNEGIEIPWKVTIENAPAGGFPNPQSYSVMVVIDCPKDTPVSVGKKLLGGVI